MSRSGDAPEHPNVMVSSTYADLAEHREAVTDALLRLGFFPLGMEFDSSKAGKDVIDSSLEMVEKARAYVGVVSHRYGGVPKDAARNPGELSITELEYRRALERGIPVYMFLMSAKHPVTMENVEGTDAYRVKLRALREDAETRSVSKQFSSVDELKGLVLQSMAEFRIAVSRPARGTKGARAAGRGRRLPSLPKPPQLLAVPDFISGHEFVGRAAELNWLDEWAAGAEDSLMVVEAIGGMGKSTLAWQWVRERARVVRPDLAGVLWYSFYEGGANMASFAAHALAYTTEKSLNRLRGRKTAELAQALVAALHARPFLLVLDGLERVLVAYHRLDASQARDDQVPSDRDHRACVKPADEELLRQLVSAAPSKVLVTSRLLPTVLTNKTGLPLRSVSHRKLGGLHTDDALAMMRGLGVRGGDATIRRYLAENFENHPLLVGIVAGLVNDYIRDPGNFDRWAEDPQGGAALSLATIDLKQRRTHILAAALNGLEPGTRQLLSRIAAFADAVPFDTIAALNPFLPPPSPEPASKRFIRYRRNYLAQLEKSSRGLPDKVARGDIGQRRKEARASIERLESGRTAYFRAPDEYRDSGEVRQALPGLVAALRELGRRGLLQWDRQKNSYDLHPVVRGYAFDILEEAERTDICNLIIDHFQSKPADRYAEARTLADVQQSINLFRALIQAGRFNEAASFYIGDFSNTLLFAVEARQEILALLSPMFAGGFSSAPRGIISTADQMYLMNDVGMALSALAHFSEAIEVHTATLRLNLIERYMRGLHASLFNLSNSCLSLNRLANSLGMLELALEVAEVIEHKERIARNHAQLMEYDIMTGRLDRAEAIYEAFRQLPIPANRAIYRPGIVELELCQLRFHQGMLTDGLLDESETIARDGNNRETMRQLGTLRGELALQRGDIPLAVESFERVVEMTQKVGIPVGGFEARLALAKARAGDRAHARAICDRLHESSRPPHPWLASAYLEIGDAERARHYALEGYRWAWADGPPYSRHWELERCREVLRTLDEPEPSLPPFDPKAVEPIPYEQEIRALITDLKKKRKKEGKKKEDSPS